MDRLAVLAATVLLAAAFSLSCSEAGRFLDALEGGSKVPADAGRALGGLEVAPPGSMAGYDREDFPHWSDAREFGWAVPDGSCDVREAALIRDGQDLVVGEGCDVESGRWRDPYTRRTFTDPLDVDIDHLVPLANAYRSGASSWDEAEREGFANDPTNLLSVEDDANAEKGDKGPEAWRPPNRAIWCSYARRWIGVKSAYGLSVTPQESTALGRMLSTCKGG